MANHVYAVSELVGSSPQAFAELVKAEYGAYGKLIREAGIKAE